MAENRTELCRFFSVYGILSGFVLSLIGKIAVFSSNIFNLSVNIIGISRFLPVSSLVYSSFNVIVGCVLSLLCVDRFICSFISQDFLVSEGIFIRILYFYIWYPCY